MPHSLLTRIRLRLSGLYRDNALAWRYATLVRDFASLPDDPRPLSASQRLALHRLFAATDGPSSWIADFASLDGYLTGLIVGPPLTLSQWFAYLFDRQDLHDHPRLARLLPLVRRHVDAVNTRIAAGKPQPAISGEEFAGPNESALEAWCRGFMLATALKPLAWAEHIDLRHAEGLLIPFWQHGTPEGRAADWRQPPLTADRLDRLLVACHAHWRGGPVRADRAGAGDEWLLSVAANREQARHTHPAEPTEPRRSSRKRR